MAALANYDDGATAPEKVCFVKNDYYCESNNNNNDSIVSLVCRRTIGEKSEN